MEIKQELISALNEISKVDGDELAYLAVTSKPEIQIRDRLAYRLHQALAGRDPEVQVSREWKRVDLAVLKSGQPLALLEAKAMTTYNATIESHRKRYRKKVLHDIEQALAKAPDAEVYALVLVTHVKDEVPQGLHEVVKYGRRLNPASVEEIDDALDRFLPEAGTPTRSGLAEGKAFGLAVAVTGWLYGPIDGTAFRLAHDADRP